MKEAYFRFYEELNDFLPVNRKKVSFPYSFRGTPSVKDTIEAIGIPHVEVDLILVNGISVGFDYALQNNDYVSVYPVFETLNISNVSHLRERPLREMRFILDVHLGKLAKYLRMLGFDTLYRNDYEDREIIRISFDEHRVILTRDLGLLKVKIVTHGYFVRSQHPKVQVAEVLKHFDLFSAVKPFRRCIKCNEELGMVLKDKIIHQLEPLTRQYFTDFFKCTGCGTIYWKGSHFERMKQFVGSITGIV
jgi:uncharacterized protein with PIN domain